MNHSASSSLARLLLSRAAKRSGSWEGCGAGSWTPGFPQRRLVAGTGSEAAPAPAEAEAEAEAAGTQTAGSPTGLGPLPERKPARPHVVVALSGGVDSAVAALLLRDSGACAEVACVHASVWSGDDEERGGGGLSASPSSPSSSALPSPSCSAAADAESAAAVARCLGLELLPTQDSVARYWLDVFEPFVAGYRRGLTPNPDLACNVSVKFGSLLEAAEAAGADVLATGHYARLRWGASRCGGGGGAGAGRRFPSAAARALGWEVGGGGDAFPSSSAATSSPDRVPQLLRAADRARDQTYFLASVGGAALARCAFPIGSLTKEQVRDVARGAAAAAGASAAGSSRRSSSPPLAPLLAASERRSSAGICFVGRRRSFGGFMAQYAEPLPGHFVDVDEAWGEIARSSVGLGGSGGGAGGGGGCDASPSSSSSSSSSCAPSPSSPEPIAACADLLALTHGQRARVGGRERALYVAAKDSTRRRVLVAEGAHHRALYCRDALLAPGEERWVAGEPPRELAQGAGGGRMRLEYKARYRQPPRPLTVERLPSAAADAAAAGAPPASPPPFEPSRLFSLLPPSRPPPPPTPTAAALAPLVARFDLPARAVTPGQALVLYRGNVCLGSAGAVLSPGRSLLELGEAGVEEAAVAAAEGEAAAGWAG